MQRTLQKISINAWLPRLEVGNGHTKSPFAKQRISILERRGLPTRLLEVIRKETLG